MFDVRRRNLGQSALLNDGSIGFHYKGEHTWTDDVGNLDAVDKNAQSNVTLTEYIPGALVLVVDRHRILNTSWHIVKVCAEYIGPRLLKQDHDVATPAGPHVVRQPFQLVDAIKEPFKVRRGVRRDAAKHESDVDNRGWSDTAGRFVTLRCERGERGKQKPVASKRGQHLVSPPSAKLLEFVKKLACVMQKVQKVSTHP